MPDTGHVMTPAPQELSAMGWQRTDDLDGTPAEQVTFGLDGKAYSIDLGEVEHAKLQAALQRFLTVATPYAELPPAPAPILPVAPPATEAARPVAPADEPPRVRGGRAASVPTKTTPEPVPQRTIRVWANANGYQVGPKGRIPEAIISAYQQAH